MSPSLYTATSPQLLSWLWKQWHSWFLSTSRELLFLFIGSLSSVRAAAVGGYCVGSSGTLNGNSPPLPPVEIEPQGAVELVLVWMWVEELFQSFKMSHLRLARAQTEATRERTCNCQKETSEFESQHFIQWLSPVFGFFISSCSHSKMSCSDISPFRVKEKKSAPAHLPTWF